MKFSELWLREWVNPAIDSEALSDQITMAGLEVDGVEPVAGSFNGVVVGEVVECGQHPNADKLRVTKVNVGGERLLDIVCGAPKLPSGAKGRGSHHRRRAAGRFQNQGREAARRAV
ncbi:phenylalanyl-tRNA synthetase subunit beta [Klebsiella pneumoniae]|uniref:Phenylalanyl-tRNA synthetase subunit beta n=1 Tax=Klebsiella pneumoniae TaxID=573 RepID=A0A378A7U8_KLEPN|nr:phenylalanyl-tRNA synthetase subunit beta [Klebsiella pneumoniae]